MKNFYSISSERNLRTWISSLTSICLIIFFTSVKIFPTGLSKYTTIINAGNARFEFLTPSLVRIEYSSKDKFIDVPTAVIEKRDWPAVKVQSTNKNGWIILTTSVMTLNYHLDSGPFNAKNLNVTWNDSTGSHHWYPGKIDSLNLGGLTYSLDNIKADNIPKAKTKLLSPVHDTIPGIDVILSAAEPGLLSLNGYAFIDDSGTPVWNEKKQWIDPREDTSGIDWYLFIYGRNYKKVLNEYADLSGRIPMIPRYTLGPWITDLNFEYFP